MKMDTCGQCLSVHSCILIKLCCLIPFSIYQSISLAALEVKCAWYLHSISIHLLISLFPVTGCPKSSFLYFISLYFSTIGLDKQIIWRKAVSFKLIRYFHTDGAIFWLEYSICVLARQRCPFASIFSSHIFFAFHSPNCSNSFLVFCEYQER